MYAIADNNFSMIIQASFSEKECLVSIKRLSVPPFILNYIIDNKIIQVYLKHILI